MFTAGVLRLDAIQRSGGEPAEGWDFNFTTDQLFMLTALPSVSGALLRVLTYSFMVPLFGGRRWTAFSTGILIVPCVWLGFAVQDTSTPFTFHYYFLAVWFCRRELCQYGRHQLFFPKQKQGRRAGSERRSGQYGRECDAAGFAPLVVRSLSLPPLAATV